MWSRPTNRAVISETWTPARNRAMIVDDEEQDEYRSVSIIQIKGGRRSPAVACWASDHWVASSNPLRGKFRH